MKKITYSILFALLAFASACSDFTEIEPKGKNVLSRVEDLDMLLNYEYRQRGFAFRSVMLVANDILPYAENIPNLLSAKEKSLNGILATWDGTLDRAILTATDDAYSECYSINAKVASAVIAKVDAAAGDRYMADRLKAEAYVLRAYMHYIVVNLYAKAYDPETAADDPGVPYIKENDALEVPCTKSTVAEVYENILADLETALELNSLPDKPINTMRVGKAFAYAVKAKALMSMHKFPEALEAAEASLAINDFIYDQRQLTGGDFVRPRIDCQEDLFTTFYERPNLHAYTDEIMAQFEPGSISFNHFPKIDESGFPIGLIIYGVPGLTMWDNNEYYMTTGGLTTIDMYLTRAECLIRSNKGDDLQEAMNVINTIREKRIDPYTPLSAADPAQAFAYLKQISRTENWFSYRNFVNLKRWNTEDAYKETLRKNLLGQEFELRPDSPLWIFPFPQNATNYNPNLTQNY